MQFISAFDPNRTYQSTSLLFIFDGEELAVVTNAEKPEVPQIALLNGNAALFKAVTLFGSIGSQDCFYLSKKNGDTAFPDSCEFVHLRQLAPKMDEHHFSAAFTAKHLIHWDATHLFCGVCGSTMSASIKERAKNCVSCGHISFPRISPAVIVAVVNNDKILLARSHNFTANFYSVIAGFVEPGETLEACVAREVKEETGISLRDISYFGSQPWPFPDSLMIGFTAHYAGGELQIDNRELSEAAWFSRDAMPATPPNRNSISRRLIDHFLNSGGT